MQPPFYYSFIDFMEKYESDFEQCREELPNITMADFLDEVGQQYLFFTEPKNHKKLDNEILYWKNVTIPSFPGSERYQVWELFGGEPGSMPVSDLISYLSDEVKSKVKNGNTVREKLDLLLTENDWIFILDRYAVEAKVLKRYEPFITFEKNDISLDEAKFKDFGYSICRILEFIENYDGEKQDSVPEQSSNKIVSKLTNIQGIGFLFSELIDRGLIEPRKRNGKQSATNTARMILEHFYFDDLEHQPNEEDLRKALFEENKLSEDKRNLIRIPTIKQINQK